MGERRNGLLFEPGNSADLAEKVQWAWTHLQEIAEMGRRARRDYEEKISLDINYAKLMEVYPLAMENNGYRSK